MKVKRQFFSYISNNEKSRKAIVTVQETIQKVSFTQTSKELAYPENPEHI